jgi:Flp pilus assembly protein TadD
MSETRRFPFGGVPVYNPLSLSKGEALAQFHARQAAYESLMKLLREERPSHVLVIGTRGMGKTTLLQRVHYGVEDDAELNGRYLVLAFPEEQYNVNRLHSFLLNAVDALADAVERLGNGWMLERVEAFAELLGTLGPEEIEERVPKFLAEAGQEMRRSFLLLVDNADRLFDTIEGREQWRLRELLSSRRDLTLFGATTQASEGVYGPDRAFFEFFQIHTLTPLTLAEVRELLLRLGESVEENPGEKGSARQRVEEWLAADAARLRTLVQLTGGNPRTTVMLFHLVLDGLEGRAREYLEQLLDQCTPTYKGRMDELPSQAQQVFDAVALRWDPVMAMEVADDTGLETSAVSTQLTRLVRQGLLEKADPGDSKKALYQVAERFFNIWYLMRASRRVRAKLRWFVEFLRVFFDSEELEQMAWERLKHFRIAERTRPAEVETAFAYVLASGADRNRIEDYLRRECADMEPKWRPYVDSMSCSEARSPDEKEGLRKAVEAEPDNAENWRRLGGVLAERREFAEAEATLLRATELDPESAWSWNSLGDVLTEIPDREKDAEAAYRKALELEPESADFWAGLGSVLEGMPERADEAEAAFRKAIELEPKSAGFWVDLGRLLGRTPERADAAEAALRKAIELKPKSARAWNNLGNLLGRTPARADEAEAALRKAIELDPKSAWPWNRLGDVLTEIPDRKKDAEVAYRNAIDLDPKSAWPWASLAYLLLDMPERSDEAEEACRKAIELDPKSAGTWANLGNLLARTPERLDEAEAAFGKALEIDPRNGDIWGNFGVFLACWAGKPHEAEAALRKSVELDLNGSRNLRNLGVLLYCELHAEQEALQFIRQAHLLHSRDPVSEAVSAAILAACARGSESGDEQLPIWMDASRRDDFWDELLGLCHNYPLFGKILLGICDLVQERDSSNGLVRLYRAVALAQLGDFPRASVALEDALVGDPIDLFSAGRKALEVFFAAAVRCGRVRDCLELLDEKGWKDAWRPIYEALNAVEAGSGEHLKRVAVEIREPAVRILRRIAPQLPGLPARTS